MPSVVVVAKPRLLIKWWLREVKGFIQSHSAKKQQGLNLNPDPHFNQFRSLAILLAFNGLPPSIILTFFECLWMNDFLNFLSK